MEITGNDVIVQLIAVSFCQYVPVADQKGPFQVQKHVLTALLLLERVRNRCLNVLNYTWTTFSPSELWSRRLNVLGKAVAKLR